MHASSWQPLIICKFEVKEPVKARLGDTVPLMESLGPALRLDEWKHYENPRFQDWENGV
jgi:hypothetical protein